MRRLCPVIILSLFFATALVPHQGRSQAPTQKQETEAAQQKSDAKKSGREDDVAPIATVPGKNANEESNQPEKNRNDQWLDGWTLAEKIAAIASLAGFFQVAALIATLWLMRKTALRQLRSYISDVNGKAIFVSSAEPRIEIDIQFRNAGQTPAYDVEIRCAHPVLAKPNDRPFDTPSPFAPVRTVIGPGNEFQIRRVITQVSSEQLRQIQNSEKAIWIWGRVDYVDAFKNPWYLVFRCFAMGGGESWKLHPAPEGYEAN